MPRRDPPKLTVTCDCGQVHRLVYGDEVACRCGRSYDSAAIPAADYAAIEATRRRFRQLQAAFVVLLGGLMLATVVLKPRAAVILVPLILMVWFTYLRPLLRRWHRRRVAALTLRWNLEAKAG